MPHAQVIARIHVSDGGWSIGEAKAWQFWVVQRVPGVACVRDLTVFYSSIFAVYMLVFIFSRSQVLGRRSVVKSHVEMGGDLVSFEILLFLFLN